MPNQTQVSEFYGWYLRHNSRTVWKNLFDAGIDVFSVGPANNTQAFLDLTNILPSMNGGFSRRWGINKLGSGMIYDDSFIVRTFLYNYPQDASNLSNTANTNLWIATNNQNFFTLTDSGIAFAGFGPSDFPNPGNVQGANSRGWFYYTEGLTAPRKVNPSYTTTNTDTLMGIALPVNTSVPPSTETVVAYSDLQNHPSVWSVADQGLAVHAPSVQGVVAIAASSFGSGQTPGAYTSTATGGGGTGAEAWYFIDTAAMPNPGEIDHGTLSYPYGPKITATGSGYTSLPTFPVLAGGTPGVLTGVLGPIAVPYVFSGYGYSSGDTVSITDPTGLGGSGATGSLILDSAGRITGFTITAGGSGYGAANVAINTSTGFGGSIVLYAVQSDRDTNGNLIGTGPVSGWDLGGNMSFSAGRQYVVALQNSLTGHTSDYYLSNLITGPKSGQGLDTLAQNTTLFPIATSTNASAGFTGYGVGISVPTTGLDTQVDTVLLLAGPDGQGVSTVYEVMKLPLSLFTNYPSVSPLFKQYLYLDTLPDTYNDYNTSGPTLLAADIWSQEDSSGNINGIALNTPPPVGFNIFTSHQGRLFATDGKTVIYSKSLDEVTTSTGLITSKWEEAWPGDYQLPIALQNETILGLKSDGTNLHVGTDQSIFTIYGSDPTTFSVPSVAFAETGILSPDCWSVVYAEGQPAGFVWITQDFKVMHSDFATYREIGTPIYPILQTIDVTKLAGSKVLSLTQGPYNFVFLQIYRTGTPSVQPEYWLWESRLQKWYHWILPITEGLPGKPGSSFVYQYPSYTSFPSGINAGDKFLFYWRGNYVGTLPTGHFFLEPRYFNPNAVFDSVDTDQNIPWSMQTSWQDLGDPTSIKVINEIEFVGEDAPFTVSLYGAASQAQFETGGTLLKTGSTIQGPIAALATNKFYCAGAPTAFKYFSIKAVPVTPGISPAALTAFALENYPIARI